MNWTHVLMAGYAGAVIATVVSLIRKKNWIGRGGAVVLTLAAIAIWNIADVHYLRSVSEQDVEHKFDAAIENMPSYVVMKEQEPQLLARIRAQVITMVKEGKNEQQVIDFIQPQILALQKKRLAFSPDDQVIAVMQVNIEQITAVQKSSNDACYRFLYPEVKGGVNAAKIISKDILAKRINADVAMLRSAYGPGRHLITDDERQNAQKNLREVIQKMLPKYGQDLVILDDPRKGLGKEKQACDMVLDLWNNILSLPKSQAAGIIRMVMAAESE
ncbi:topoisomerase II [Pantoea alhagi]|uniref:topoisomerase II n=1 Tax=Pantoea alhagi TaxID=1891675 RepID=UPI00202B6F4E|nr:topoisomerase II [Pantoea alhagi]URQ62212.1 topoisomerase II [Pantoea alhagi]